MTARTTRVLIGYGSRFGSTKAIAMRIADTVRARGADVDVCAVDDITDCNPYDGVVLGSGVYDGSWTPGATDLVRRQSGVLARKPVWLFSVGSFGDGHPVVGGLIKKEPKEIEEFERAVHPHEYRVFAGVIDLDHWPTWGRLLFKAFGGRAGDNRDWPEIDSWAAHISDQLQLEPAIHGATTSIAPNDPAAQTMTSSLGRTPTGAHAAVVAVQTPAGSTGTRTGTP